jgi:hypothetical protein
MTRYNKRKGKGICRKKRNGKIGEITILKDSRVK